jgi:TolB-like protein
MRQLVALVALSSALCTPAVARSQTTVAVLGFEPIEVPEDVANQVTQALRQRASQARQVKVVAGKALVELKLTFGCLDEAPACMAPIGGSLGAEKLLFGAVRKGRGGYAVTVKYFDVGRQRVENEQTFQVLRSEANAAGLKTAADHWFGAVTGLKNGATLRIAASAAGAKIYVDDKLVGTASGFEPVTVGDLEPGRHAVRVERKGYKTYRETVRVAAGDSADVNAQLEKEEEIAPLGPPGPTGPGGPTGVPAPTGPGGPLAGGTEAPGRASRIAFWSTAGAAVVTVAIAGYAAWKVSDLGNQKTQAMQAACKNTPTDPSCLAYSPDAGCEANPNDWRCYYYIFGNDACTAARKVNVNTGQARNPTVADLCSEGQSWATTTWVLFPIAGAFAVASGYFLWNGYIRGGGTSERQSALVRNLTLSPVIGPGTAAMSAELRF